MANKPRAQVRREMDIIQDLMYGKDNLSDEEIIDQLQINDRTFRRYKKRIELQYAKVWEKEGTDRARYTYAKFNRTLEYCYRETKKIIDNPNSKPLERVEAIKTLDVLAGQIAELGRDGPIFKPQLPQIKGTLIEDVSTEEKTV